MKSLIAASFKRPRTILVALVIILIAGTVSYINIPKESAPDVTVPLIYVSLAHPGISPQDSIRLLVKPMEQELKSLTGLEEIRATAGRGYAYLILEFEPGFNADEALDKVRNRVDRAESELPQKTEQPEVKKVNFSLFPVLIINLYGQISERKRVNIAEQLQDKLEALSGVLEIRIGGDREEQIEIVIEPTRLRTYGLSLQQIASSISNNNQLVAAGALTLGSGRFPITVPGVINDPEELLNIAIKESKSQVITLGDVATVRRTFKDPTGHAWVNGEPALTLEVVKRPGANIIETVAAVRSATNAASKTWPEAMKVSYSQDRSKDIRSGLSDLLNNVAASVLLVMILILAILGVRAGLLVGVSIPGSFLLGILVIASLGLTMNIVVLFSLILALGLLVDGAITVVELADRYQAEGQHRADAYMHASQRLAWPIISSTLCMIAAYMPLLFWPGIMGEFMLYLPVTLIAVLSASLLMALVFVPNLGGVIGGTPPSGGTRAWKPGDPLHGFDGAYVRMLRFLLRHAGKVVIVTILALVGTFMLYGYLGKGTTFFPKVEPDNAVVKIRARDSLSLNAIDRQVNKVESRIINMDAFDSVYTRTGLRFRSTASEDLIGKIQLEFKDWQKRPPTEVILSNVRERISGIPGLKVTVTAATPGPTQPKPVKIRISGVSKQTLDNATEWLLKGMHTIGGFIDITDTRPSPGLEWRLEVDRSEAARYGANVTMIGQAIKLATRGIKVGEYQAKNADDELDIRLRYPEQSRDLSALSSLRLRTADGGMVPLSNFVDRTAAQKINFIHHINGQRTVTVQADIEPGTLVAKQIKALKDWIDKNRQDASFGSSVQFKFAGDNEDRKETSAFLFRAFLASLALIALIMLTQFNSFYQAFLVLSAVVFSIIGVLLGLIVTQRPFGVVMSGVGVISLAGVVVNTNIVLIDTYNLNRADGASVVDAILMTGAERLRPVVLTSITNVVGLIPMVFMLNINLFEREVSHGAPSTQWWTQLATAVAGGLLFATVLTLIVTPSLIMLGARVGERYEAFRNKRKTA